MEIKSFPFEVKSVDEDAGTFEGYASVFGNVDDYGDIMMPGAFTKTLLERADRVKVLWQHDPWTPIGKPIEMREDKAGLYTKSKISQTQAGRDALTLLRDGVVNELSIGYRTIKENRREDGTRELLEVKLYEYSLVTWAANDLAVVTGVKSLDELNPLLRRAHYLASNLKTHGIDMKQVEQTRDALKQALDLLEALADGKEPVQATPAKSEPPIASGDPDIQSLQALIDEIKSLKEVV